MQSVNWWPGETRVSAPPACTTISDRVAAAVGAIRGQWSCEATTAVILGTGLGELADEVSVSATLSYRDIPGFARSTALAHKGRLVCGELAGTPVVMLQGRCHLYEGYARDQLAFPVRVLAGLGVTSLIVTNAAGGLNPAYTMGDVMLIDDHINLMWLPGLLSADRGTSLRPPREHTRLYDRTMASRALAASRAGDFPLQRGVYVAVTGPSYETRAEYRAFRRIGGDCVGMSTIPEVLTAAACGMTVLGLSTVTNVACPDAPKVVSAEEVVEVARIARPRVRAILEAVVRTPQCAAAS
jgi:purine-nucleoside phosphorylase